jgi:TM2 domain-containing membrane protein YozV
VNPDEAGGCAGAAPPDALPDALPSPSTSTVPMSKILRHLPELEGDEQVYVAQLLKPMTDEQAQQFAHVYRSRRKDETTILIMAAIGFAGVSGVQRFYLDQVGMGLLYLLTAGLCMIGTLLDMVRYKDLALRYNRQQADEVASMVEASYPDEDDEA